MKRPRIQQDDAPGGLTHNPFAALRADGKPARADAPPSPPVDGDAPARPERGRVVVQREKKGRGGKTVTRVTGLDIEGAELESLARDMKRALGCGASLDGRDVLLQGSLTERAAAWLEERLGVGVTIGN